MGKTQLGYTLSKTDYWDLQSMLREYREKRNNNETKQKKSKYYKEKSNNGDK